MYEIDFDILINTFCSREFGDYERFINVYYDLSNYSNKHESILDLNKMFLWSVFKHFMNFIKKLIKLIVFSQGGQFAPLGTYSLALLVPL